ncbi:ATP-binding protein [Conexibacter sp. CPCC 206217]|uniref:ATP-binding protein n=1 Tax=Conexibacter sp. CPCC 206217 TaxID=3064574 RepID=UPI002721C168|nr:ATP-binding protein [Conexibacter sp. CPCC 206217]MDO8213910.1 ATP-binding protein [Conexibacter sp. CPCC 206217]
MTGVRFPLRYVRQNLLFGRGGEPAAVFRLGLVSYPFLPAAEKWRQLRLLERWATVVGADFSLYRVSRAYPAERYVEETTALLDARGQDADAFAAYLHGHERRLSQLAAHAPELYAVVSLGEPAVEGFARGVVRSVDRARLRVEDLAGVAAAQPISGVELDGLAVAEQRVFEQLRGVLACERATTRELEWLLRRVELRGIGEPVLDPHWRPDALVVTGTDGGVAYEPLQHDLWRCCNAPLLEPRTGPARLVAESEQGDSHQAFLCVGELADEPEFPGPAAELLFAPLEAVPFSVDAVLHARWVGNRDALAQVRRRITDVENVYREQTEGDTRGPGLLVEEDRYLAREYEAVLQSSAHPPMLYASLGFAIGAPDGEELERRVTALQDQFGDLRLYRPRGIQSWLFAEHLLRVGAGVPDYTNQLTVEQFAALMATGTTEIGSASGIYLGITGGAGGRPVKHDPTAASRQSRPSAVLLAGTLGSGKTVAAQTIAYAAERRGSSVVDFDPKPDHGFDRIRQLDGRVEVLELSGAEQHRGALDPLAIGLDDLREELASSYYLDLLRDPPPSWENQIQRAVRELVRRGERSSLAVIGQLRSVDHPAAQEVADALEVAADFGLGRLGFGDGSRTDLGTAAAPVTTIRAPGLTLPDPRATRESWTRAERVSVATLSLVAALALRLVSGDRSRHKVIVLDEAWFLLSSTQGRALINRLVRLGRAFNATVLLATQRLDDLGDLSDLIGTFLLFGQDSDAEAKQGLQLLGLDPDDRGLVARVRSYRRGLCLLRDLDGRVGETQIDVVFEELLHAFNTTPEQAGA